MQKNAADMTVKEFEEWLKNSHTRLHTWLSGTQGRSSYICSQNAKSFSAMYKPTPFTNQTRRAMNRGASKWKP
jgi:hypothetical protein